MNKLLSFLALFLPLTCFAAGNETITPLPAQQPNASSYTQTRTFLRDELPAVLSRYGRTDFVVAGGYHAGSATMISPAFATEAFTSSANRVTADGNGGAVAINYSTAGCATTDTAWVIISARTGNTVNQFVRAGTSNYFVDCTTSPSPPALPSDSAWLLRVGIVGGALTQVGDIRLPASIHTSGEYDITDPLYGAVGDNVTDSTPAIQTAMNAAAGFGAETGHGGNIVYFPRGKFRTTAPLTLLANTILRGAGRQSSLIVPDHTGNAVISTETINIGPSGKYTELRDIGIDRYLGTHPNTGGGFVDIAGAFITLENVFMRSSAAQVVLDQSEHVRIRGSEFVTDTGFVGLWIVGDDSFTTGSLPGFTNVISVTDCQFNGLGLATHIRDDGGSNHNITSSNFNAGGIGIRAANTSNLIVRGNFFEGQITNPIQLLYDTAVNGTIRYANFAPIIEGNGFSTTAGAGYHISIFNAHGGSISNNTFVGSSGNVAGVVIADDGVTDVLFEGNVKAPPPSLDIYFVDAGVDRLKAQRYRQRLQSFSGFSAAAGVAVITPVTMGAAGTLERVKVGEQILVQDKDLLTREYATVTAATATTLTVTLANSYAAQFMVFGSNSTESAEPVPPASNYGTGLIPSGSTTVTITHALGYTPFLQDILIFPAADITSPIYNIWVNTITSTQFQVNVTADPGTVGFAFGWRVLPSPYRR